ncbi:transcription elongation factor B polypeptide 3 [Tribolium castaneum]|uniref:Transcription elongation factor B polypeptide 3-like Protein n=1 Tax=Tribolium castaneum TaxID=7070 RepID=D7EK50_TRICA|nr:PREDICTED: transcription elongation factor B polypeptide 3 [Tribolium castaneum]EFA12997.1 Transcription elongation factor B polypeptide 3-like Protein [Tribolium castaneum]|eukprot:XP_008193753.1 PREDICTED: transcription elongation factor B polypeptide 3 [Tribolium castaneum]
MGESHENLLRVVRHCQESLDKYTENRNDGKLLHYIEKLYRLPIKVVHLEQTGVGRTVNGLRKLGGDVGDSAKSLVAKWKEMVVGEQEEEEEEDDDEDEDDEDEDGYQSGEEPSNDSDDKDGHEEKSTPSSQHKRDNDRTDDRERVKKSKSDGSETSRRHRHNGHEKKAHKRKSEESSSEEETARKRPKKEEERQKSSKRDEERRHKAAKKAKAAAPDFEEKKDSGRHKSKKDDRKSKDKKIKDEKREKSDEKKTKSSKKLNGNLVNGIDSGSGASFAEALGMCEPSSSKNSAKKKVEKVEKVEKKKEKSTDQTVPKLLKEPTLDPIDLNISSLLPPITPNYRPLGNLLPSDSHHKKFMSESEALTSIITSKNQRTKVYSGNKMGCGKVASLFDLCIRVLQDNIDALEYTGGVPYNVLKPILEKANPNQLYLMEHHNPYLIEDTDELWQLHCQKDFRNKKREELETWREMYLRCLDERDAKLKALTANIKQAQDKSLPVRMTKLAYVDAVAKPPRNIARKQAKNGTAFDVRKTASAKLSSLATAGEAGKVSVPNPGSRAVERPSAHAKPKKAPLMLKSISSFKNRFKR